MSWMRRARARWGALSEWVVDGTIALLIAGGLVTVAAVAAAMLAVDVLRFLPTAVLALATAWLLVDRQRTRRAYTAELERRAARLEREREDRTRLAASQERSRIAGELHDVVAHSLSAIVVQATAARRMLARDPRLADEPLAQVETIGRESLAEMRRLLDLLRSNGDRPQLAPQPSVAQLDEIVDQVRATGLPVLVTIQGDRRPLPSGVDLSVVRIVQEALTNVQKHAGPATTATVLLDYQDRALRLEVADDGRGPATDGLDDGTGHGLVGIRERVALLDGSLHLGPRPGGGFLLRALLPLGRPGAHPLSGGAA